MAEPSGGCFEQLEKLMFAAAFIVAALVTTGVVVALGAAA